MVAPVDRQRRLEELSKEIDALEYRGRIVNDIKIGANNILQDIEKLMRFVERQEPYIRDLILHDINNAKTYTSFIKTSTEVELEEIPRKVKEKRKEMETLKQQLKRPVPMI